MRQAAEQLHACILSLKGWLGSIVPGNFQVRVYTRLHFYEHVGFALRSRVVHDSFNSLAEMQSLQ